MTRRAVVLGLSVLLLISGNLRGQTKSSADTLIDRALNKFDYANSVTAKIEIALPALPSAAPDEAPGITLNAKVVNDGKGRMAKSRFEFTAPPAATPDATIGEGEWVLVDDGKRLYTLYPHIKQFLSAARKPEKFSSLFRPTIDRMRARGVVFKIYSGSPEGKPAYVISGESIDGFTAQIVVDKATSTLRSIVVATPTRRVVNQFVVQDIVLNPPIAASQFQRPADYKVYNPDEQKPEETKSPEETKPSAP